MKLNPVRIPNDCACVATESARLKPIEKEIPFQMDRLTALTRELDGTVTALLERLAPALRPTDPTPAPTSEKQPRAVTTQLGQTLADHCDGLRRAVDCLQGIINGLEL